MFGDEENLKDNHQSSSTTIASSKMSAITGNLSFNKVNKLITAVYMVTDIIEADEPIRNKLRTLGVEIISDINNMPEKAHSKISEIMSFLNIASTMNIISEMNCNILKKEFVDLKNALPVKDKSAQNATWLEEFLLAPVKEEIDLLPSTFNNNKYYSIGHIKPKPIVHNPTRIGVQKGNTLMRALKDVSDKKSNLSNSDFNLLKTQRREDIIFVIKNNPNGATITDIKKAAHGTLASCGEKTLQRELVSMVGDNLLHKTGSKRWSRYFLAK